MELVKKERDIEIETITFWMDVATYLGLPKSVGETYGLLFSSPKPLTADDIVDKLGISRSGAGQCLKALSEIGAIRLAAGIQSRKEHYELQTDLGILIRNFLSSRILPRIHELNRQRLTLAESAAQLETAHLVTRFEKLNRWCEKTQPISALVNSLIKN